MIEDAERICIVILESLECWRETPKAKIGPSHHENKVILKSKSLSNGQLGAAENTYNTVIMLKTLSTDLARL